MRPAPRLTEPVPPPRGIASARERLERTSRATSRTALHEAFSTPGFIPSRLSWPFRIVLGLFAVPLVALLVLDARWAIAQPAVLLGFWNNGALVGLPFVLVIAVWALLGMGRVTIGIAPTDDGVRLFERPIRQGQARTRTISWASLEASPANLRRVWLTGDVLGAYVSYEQARAVLSDARCALRDRLPAELRRTLHLE